ncbi:MAG TPA: DUF983 domain-containing protein [Hyphomicrobiales bacterium]|nr:DUF983 domain-containing protein [Hyphomicrobiales bacterium]
MAARFPPGADRTGEDGSSGWSDEDWGTPASPFAVGFRGRCPRCGRGHLFRGYIDIAERCEVCGLDYSFADAGDGPAVFVILIAGCLVLGLALWIEFTFSPPFWVHLLVSLPLLVVVCGGLLRPLKGVLLALQYRNRAAEGRLDE